MSRSRVGRTGSFAFRKFHPMDCIAIRGRSEVSGAVTNGAILVKMREQKGPLTITIDPKFAYRIRGTVADRAGKPIEGAEVMLQWTRKMPSDDPRRSGSMGST